VSQFIYFYVECFYADCGYAECHYSEYLSAACDLMDKIGCQYGLELPCRTTWAALADSGDNASHWSAEVDLGHGQTLVNRTKPGPSFSTLEVAVCTPCSYITMKQKWLT
jgi:hypothetical protein